MLKNYVINLFFFALFSLPCFSFAQSVESKSAIPQNSPIRFHGVVGSVAKSQISKPLAIMVADVPKEQVKIECTFFHGDSLMGFDFNESSHLAESDGAKMYAEFKGFMYLKEAQFVKAKYHIANLPGETSFANKKVTPPFVLSGICNNLDFENGSFNGWVTGRGYNAGSGTPLTVMQSPTPYIGTNDPFDACDDLNIITSAYGNDPYGGFPGLDPNGGTYSCRIGGRDMNTAAGVAYWSCDATKYKTNGVDPISYSNGEQLSETFVVTTANDLVSFDYAVILCDGNHAVGEQPYFSVVVTDSVGNILSPATCNSYYVEAIAGVPPPGFVNTGFVSPSDGVSPFYAQSWKSNSINLNPYLGHTITLTFMSAGCLLGGHPAWAYIDATCGPLTITVVPANPCVGGTSTLTAPIVEGGSYQWTGPGIVGSPTNQSVVVNTTGTYSVTVTPSQGATCAYTLSVSVTFSTLPIINFSSSANVSCNGGNNGNATANPTGGNPAYTYAWNPTAQITQTATGLSAGNYSVIVTDSHGCSQTATVAITQPTLLTNTIPPPTNVNCNGGSNGSATSNPAGGTPGYTYSWNTAPVQTTQSATGLSAGNYSVTVKDANGCVTTSTVTITQPTVLNASINPTNATCGIPNGSAIANTSGGTFPYTYLWNNAQTTSAINNLSAGNYSVTVTDSHGCVQTANSNVATTVAVSLSLQTANVSCFGGSNGSVTPSMSSGTSPFTYLWNNAQTTSAINNLTMGNYSVEVTDANGCTATLTAVINQPTVLTATNSQTNVSCNGGNDGKATVNASGGTTNYSYLWTNAETTSSASGLSAGNYSVTITDANGCTFPVAFIITQPTAITATTSSTNEICNHMNGTASVTASGGTGNLSYQWNPTGQITPTASGLSAGNYSLTITDANACTYSTIVTVNPTAGPTVNAGPSASVCFGNTAQLNASGGGNYLWTPATGLSSATISNPTANPISTTTYTLVVTDMNGCTSTDAATVTINPLPVPNAGPNQNVCFGFSTTINASGGVNYLWTPATGLSSTVVSNPAANPTSTTTYSLTVTDANGCTNTTSMTVVVNALPVPSFLDHNVCLNNLNSFINQSTGTTVWAWNFGEPSSGQNNISSLINPNHTYSSPGTYSITLVVTSQFGCKDSVSHTVVVNPLPIANFSATSVCVGTPTTFTDISAISSGSITTWSWTFADPNSGPNNSSSLQNPTHVFTQVGNYNVVFTVTSDSGCQSTTTIPVMVFAYPVAAFSVPNVCNNSLAIFTDNSTGAQQWAWQFGDNTTSNLQNPVHTYTSNGTYVVTLTVTAAGGCTDTISDTITIYPLPVPFFISDSVCLGKANSFTDLSSVQNGTITAWLWDFGDGDTSSLQNPTHVYSSSGIFTATLTTTSSYGCKNSVALTVVVYPKPTADFSSSPAPIITFGDATSFGNLSSSDVAQWFWAFGDGDSLSPNNANPSHTYLDTGNFIVTLIVVSNEGCWDTIKHPLRVEGFAFYVPNSFTPNGDGIDDQFGGFGIGIVTYEMLIFDRWGNLIFISEDYYQRWDGTVNGGSGVLVQEDVYIYKIKITDVFGNEHKYIGRVTMIR